MPGLERERHPYTFIQFQIYPDATHDFDDPSCAHQEDEANAAATSDVISQ
jgi:dienelactone hydrolase